MILSTRQLALFKGERVTVDTLPSKCADAISQTTGKVSLPNDPYLLLVNSSNHMSESDLALHCIFLGEILTIWQIFKNDNFHLKHFPIIDTNM